MDKKESYWICPRCKSRTYFKEPPKPGMGVECPCCHLGMVITDIQEEPEMGKKPTKLAHTCGKGTSSVNMDEQKNCQACALDRAKEKAKLPVIPEKIYRRVQFVYAVGKSQQSLLKGRTDQGSAILEILGGDRDGEIVRDVPHDPQALRIPSWYDPKESRLR